MTTLANERKFKVSGGKMYYRANEIKSDQDTLLFIHGLGESGLCFIEAFQEPMLQQYNILVPDLLGFGKSSSALDDDYAFETQVKRIKNLLDKIQVQEVHLIGHSMGGDIGVKLCIEHPARIKTFVNIEGDLTPYDRFITDDAIRAIRNGDFEKWYQEKYIGKKVVEWAENRLSCRRYLSSLETCQPKAFKMSVEEIYKLNEESMGGESKIGKEYRKLPIPTIFCWGKDSLSRESQQYLIDNQVPNQAFEGAAHWVMVDRPEAFYNFLAGFLMIESVEKREIRPNPAWCVLKAIVC